MYLLQFVQKTNADLEDVKVPVRDNSLAAKHFKQTSVRIQFLG